MSRYYTVTINQLQLVSKFDAAGNKISDETIKIPVTHNDLPYSTAMMYVGKCAAGEVTIVEQIQEFAPGRHARKTEQYIEGVARFSHRAETKAIKHIGSEDLKRDAAASGDMAAAITASMKDVA